MSEYKSSIMSVEADSRCLRDGPARSRRNFSSGVIVHPDHIGPTFLCIVSNRALLLDQHKAVLLQETHQFAELHQSSIRGTGPSGLSFQPSRGFPPAPVRLWPAWVRVEPGKALQLSGGEIRTPGMIEGPSCRTPPVCQNRRMILAGPHAEVSGGRDEFGRVEGGSHAGEGRRTCRRGGGSGGVPIAGGVAVVARGAHQAHPRG